MKQGKRIISLILALAIIFGYCPGFVHAAESTAPDCHDDSCPVGTEPWQNTPGESAVQDDIAPQATNIVMNSVDIGYAAGDYFTKNGSSCANSYWSNGKCHNNNVCVSTAHPNCNCMRYWPTGNSTTCQVDLLGSQCLAFARYCQWKVYGSFATGTSSVWTDLTGTLSSSSCTASTLKAKLKGCAPATHIRTPSPHSLSVISTSDSGITLADANYDGYCRIRTITYTWAEFAAYVQSRGGLSYAYARVGVSGETPSCSCSTAYAGQYVCTTTTTGLNIRSGHGSSYSVIGTIPSGATVTVSKASGTGSSDWAHVTYGGVSGYASMQYLSKVPTATPAVSVWISDSALGETPAQFKAGNRYYLCYRIYDTVSGKDWDEVAGGSYSVTVTCYDPDGSVNHSATFTEDQSWISVFFTSAGTYSMSAVVSGSISKTGSKSFTVSNNPKNIYASADSLSLQLGGTESSTVYVWTDGYYNGSTSLAWSASNSNITCSWGTQLDDGRHPLTVTAKAAGTTTLTLLSKATDTGEILDSMNVTVTVTAKSYTVSYNANGGSGAPGSQSKQHGTALTLSTAVPTRFGYTFLGWATSSTATSAACLPGGSFTANANTTLYAVWQAAATIAASVTNGSYSADIAFAGGVRYFKFVPERTSSYRFESAGSLDPRICLYDASGSQLAADDDGGSNANFLLEYPFTAGTTYYLTARLNDSATGTVGFTAKRLYEITYDANGGSGAPGAQTKVHGTALTLSTTVPTRVGHTFQGWAASAGADTADYRSGGNFTTNADTTLYAVWKANSYTVTFNANGGSNAPSSQTKTHGVPLTLTTAIPSRSGYTFQGWATSATSATAAYQPGGSFTANVNTTLYAVWKANSYIVTYDANGGSNAPNPQTKTHGAVLTLRSGIPTRPGYTFLGWAAASGAPVEYYPGSSFTGNADTTLYAVWEAAAVIPGDLTSTACTAVMPFDGGDRHFSFTPAYTGKFRVESSGSGDPMVFLYDADGNQLASDEDSGTDENFRLTWSVTAGSRYFIRVKFQDSGSGTISFTAKRAYDVAYNANGGSGAPGAQVKVYGTALTLRSGVPTRDGYIFRGWAPSASAASAVYQPGDSYTANAAAILYAVWEADCSSGHSYGSYTLSKAPTLSAPGALTGTCSRCGSATSVTLPMLNTTDYAYQVTTAPGCTLSGTGRYTWNTTAYGHYAFDVTLAPLGHEYQFGTCIRCGDTDPDYNMTAWGWSGDLIWELSPEGVMTFSGSGAMRNYTYKSEMPWYGYMDQIRAVVLEEGVTSIGSYAFYGMTALKSVTIPRTVTTIGSYAFKGATALETVVLPPKLTQLGESAFYGCTALTAVDIPASLYTVRPYTFKNCTALASVTFHEGSLQKISDGAFYNTALTALALPDCLNILDSYAFKNCAGLTDITLGSGLTQIREAAFYGTAIPAIVIPEGITSIGPYAFKNCLRLASVTLPSTLAGIGEAAFYGCTALERLELPDALTKIGSYAFRRCAGLRDVSFGTGLVTIGECAFYGSGITALRIPAGITTIGGYAFKACAALETVELPGSLTTLGDSAFHTCTSLTGVTIPAGVTKIGAYCFSGSTALNAIRFLGDAPAIGDRAFNRVAATAYYPGGNATWTEAVRQNYGGSITWTAQ